MTEPARHLFLVPEELPAADPWVGRILDSRYRILRVLGTGGMGMVYEARHTVLDRRLAIKVLRADVSRNDAVIARFEREARAASAIGSRHICDVSDFGVLPDGSAYLVMEYLDGPSLRAALVPGTPMVEARVLQIGAQVCDALGAAHAAGIVHRDLKPDNVHLVVEGGAAEFVKVLDFGIAKVGDSAEKGLTKAGEVFGTPRYMSPEQCAGMSVDHRTDIYALGIMLYEMACGQVPFDADNLMGLLTKQVYERPLTPRELAPPVDVGPGLEAVIMRCLEKSPSARYATMAELRQDLDAVARAQTPRALLGVLDRVSEPHPSSSGIVPARARAVVAPARSRTARFVAVGVVLACAAFAFGATFFAWDELAPEPHAEPILEPVDETIVDPVDETVVHEVVAEQRVERTDVAPMATPVRLTSDPVGAEIYGPDGAFLGITPLDLERTETTTTYQVRLEGYQDRSVAISSLTQDALTLRLSRRRTVRPPVDVQHNVTHTNVTEEPAEVRHTLPPTDWSRETDPRETELINPFRGPPNRRPAPP